MSYHRLTFETMQTRISSKGQVVIPKAIRGVHHWPAGTVLQVEEKDGGILLRPARSAVVAPDHVFGCLKNDVSRKVSLEEMDATVFKLARDSHHGRG